MVNLRFIWLLIPILILTAGCVEKKIFENEIPEVEIFSSNDMGYAPLEVEFRCNATDKDGEISGYTWIIDGINISNEKKCAFTFLDVGIHRIEVIARDNNGGVARAIKNISVFGKYYSLNFTPKGMSCSNGHLFLSDGSKIYKLNTTDLETEETFTPPVKNARGIAYADGDFFISKQRKIMLTGEEVKKQHFFLLRKIGNIDYADGYLWAIDERWNRILKIDTNGNIIEKYATPYLSPSGIAYDGKCLWIGDKRKNEIYRMENGIVTLIFPSPIVPECVEYDGQYLWIAGERGIYKIDIHCSKYIRYSPRSVKIDFSDNIQGNGEVSARIAYPFDMPHQRIEQLELTEGYNMTEDEWGQKIAVYNYTIVGKKNFGWHVKTTLYNLRYLIFPEEVGKNIPDEILKNYTVDDEKYKINDPFIQKIVSEVADKENNLYWKARKLHDYVASHLRYKLEGGWDDAVTTLKRGTGSCSEYSFAYIALCRAAGIPARYIGGSILRGEYPYEDTVFHRIVEIYLPNYGWVPVDVDADDKLLSAEKARYFGAIGNDFFITTREGGESRYMGWDYNAHHVYEGKEAENENVSVATWYKGGEVEIKIDKKIVIGKIEVKATIKFNASRVEFYVNDRVVSINKEMLYFEPTFIGIYEMKVVAYDWLGHIFTDEKKIVMFPLPFQ